MAVEPVSSSVRWFAAAEVFEQAEAADVELLYGTQAALPSRRLIGDLHGVGKGLVHAGTTRKASRHPEPRAEERRRRNRDQHQREGKSRDLIRSGGARVDSEHAGHHESADQAGADSSEAALEPLVSAIDDVEVLKQQAT